MKLTAEDIKERIWKLESITHGGRKGDRETPRIDDKYDGLIGCLYCFADTPKRGKEAKLYVKNHPYYNWWGMSIVLAIWVEEDDTLAVETENSIYRFTEYKTDKNIERLKSMNETLLDKIKPM